MRFEIKKNKRSSTICDGRLAANPIKVIDCSTYDLMADGIMFAEGELRLVGSAGKRVRAMTFEDLEGMRELYGAHVTQEMIDEAKAFAKKKGWKCE